MELLFTGVCITITVFISHTSGSITSLSPDQLTQITDHQSIVKEPKPNNLFTNPLILKPDDNDQYVDDTVRISKRDTDLNSISVVDLVKGAMSYQPSKKTIRSANLKSEKARDLVFEIVREMIEKEKSRRNFDLVNPPNSKYTKKEQLLWDRLRIKAAEDVLLHQKPVPPRPTERMFNNLKMDLQEEDPEVTLGPELFPELKRKVEKQFYIDQHSIGRLYVSTLKPVY